MDGFESQIEEGQKAKRSEIKSTEARRRGGSEFLGQIPRINSVPDWCAH